MDFSDLSDLSDLSCETAGEADLVLSRLDKSVRKRDDCFAYWLG